MRKFNFLSKSGSRSCGLSSVTLASTVGSPSVHRRGAMLKLLSVLVLILTIGVGQMWGNNANKALSDIATENNWSTSAGNTTYPYTSFDLDDNIIVSVNSSGNNGSYYSNGWRCYESADAEITISADAGYEITSITITYAVQSNSGCLDGLASNTADDFSTAVTSQTYTVTHCNGSNKGSIAVTNISVTYQSSCSNSVSISAGTPTNATINVGATSLQTCSSTATDRQVTVSVAPASCYAAPIAASVTWTGTAASKTTRKSGPIWNGSTNKYDYVFEFDKDAAGAIQFNISLSTKTTYTVSYNKGTYGTGDNDSGTKTCGEALTLPNTAMFEREGYTQAGWSTAPAGNTKTYNLGGNYTNNSATTLYPYWEANDCTITWVVNGEPWTGKGGSTTAKYDGKVANLPSAPNTTTDGCGDKFMGWTSNNIGEAVLDKTDDAATISTLNCFTDVDGSPVIQGATIFYAVFAEYVEK